MSNLKLPVFTTQATKLWDKLSVDDKTTLLGNVYCSQCKGETTMFSASGKAEKGCLVLQGRCAVCMSPVGRFVEADWFK